MLSQIYRLLIACKHYIFDQYSKVSYSVEGEDIVFSNIESKRYGIYVDVGAHHPFRFSNTYKLYKLGWNGLNIDAQPGSMRLFRIFRPRDTNLEIGIGKKRNASRYFSFNEPAINTFDPKLAKKYILQGHKVVKIYKIPVKTLAEIFDKWLNKQKIDLLSIDVEGLDYEVLRSNNWKKYKPSTIIIEDCDFRIDKPDKSRTYHFLRNLNYSLRSVTGNSTIYVNSKQ